MNIEELEEEIRELKEAISELRGGLSILGELHGEITLLEHRITKLENSKSQYLEELSTLPGKKKAIALSEIDVEEELSSNTEALIEKAVDSIIRYGRKIPYIERGG